MPSRALALFAAILWLALLSSCGKSPAQFVAQGQDLLKENKEEEAKLLFEKALQTEPENPDAHFALGSLLRQQGRNFEALDHLRRAAQSNKPEHLKSLARLQLQTYLENPASAGLEAQVRDTARKLGASPEASRIEGYLAVLDRRPEDAIRHFEAALAQNPQLEDVQLALLQQLLATDQQAKAQALLAQPSAVRDALIDTYYLHLLATQGCPAAEVFFSRQNQTALKLAAHKRRCGGPAAEEAVLAPLRDKADLTRAEAIQLGDYYSQQSDWARALPLYQKAPGLPAGITTPDGSLELRQSSALIGLGRFDEAAKILDAYLAAHPNDANARGQRGILRLSGAIKAPDVSLGLEDLRRAVGDPAAQTTPELRLHLAMNLVRFGQLAEARHELQDLKRFLPGVLALQLIEAELELRDGRPQVAEKLSHEVLLQNPNLREARLIRSLSLAATGQEQKALLELRRLAQEFPDDPSITVQLLAVLANTDDPEYPILLRKLQAKSNLSSQSASLLAEILYRKGDRAGAERLWQRLAQENGDLRARLRLVEAGLTQGQHVPACASLETLAPLEPRWTNSIRAHWWGLRGICRQAQNKLPEATSAHRKALELSPGDPVFSNNLASSLADQGQNLDEAQRLAEAAVAKRPDEIQYLDTLGWVYHQRQDQNRARLIYQKLSARRPLPPGVESHAKTVLEAR
jgi:tetratricopeptide (TPR) repeat protein